MTITPGSTPESPGPRWIKSSRSFANSNCVEVASLPDGHIGVRDSKHPSGPILRFTPSEWIAFLTGTREFDDFMCLSQVRASQRPLSA